MFKEMDRGKYISLQNSRFFSGCCYYHKQEVVVATKFHDILDHESEIWEWRRKNDELKDRIEVRNDYLRRKYHLTKDLLLCPLTNRPYLLELINDESDVFIWGVVTYVIHSTY